MNALDMIGLIDAMEKRLFARVNLADADYASVVENKLESEALEALGEDLRQAAGAEGVAWLLKRMVRLEARVGALSQALQQSWPPAAETKAASPSAPERVVVPMDEDIVQSGFFHTERSAGNIPFRWLGPAPVARVYLPKFAPPLEIMLVLAAAYKGVDLKAVHIAFNDGPWSAVHVDCIGGATVLRGRPKPGPDSGGLLDHIDIDCGATFCPADDGGDDRRRLGIALLRIELARL